MNPNKLSSIEKKELVKLIRHIQSLCPDKVTCSDIERFCRKQQLKYLLSILKADNRIVDIRLRAAALDIINDWKPFKIRRVRKLINERKPKH